MPLVAVQYLVELLEPTQFGSVVQQLEREVQEVELQPGVVQMPPVQVRPDVQSLVEVQYSPDEPA